MKKRWLKLEPMKQLLILTLILIFGFLLSGAARAEDAISVEKAKVEEIENGTVYTLYVVENQEDTFSLRKDLYLNDMLIYKRVDDFLVYDHLLFFSAGESLLSYDLETENLTRITERVHLYDLQIVGGFLCGIDDLRGMAQLYAVSLDNYEVIPTNYTGVNSYSFENGQLRIEIALRPEEYPRLADETITVPSSAAIQDADKVTLFSEGLESMISLLEDPPTETGDSDIAVLSAAVSFSSVQPAILDLPRLYVTQGANGNYSHTSKNAFDIDASYSGKADIKAPFDGTIRFAGSSLEDHAVWFQSDNLVEYANGEVSKMTVLTMHDNDVSDLSPGTHFQQGAVYTQEGDYGNASGIHVHLECIRGEAGSYAWQTRGNVLPNEALYLSSTTKIDNAGGVNWKVYTGLAHTEHVKGEYLGMLNVHPHHSCYRCTECDITFSDDSTSNFLSSCSICHPSHNWGDFVVTKEATFTSYGEKTWTCTLCGETVTDTYGPLDSVTAQYRDNIRMTYHRDGLLEIYGTGEFSVLGRGYIDFSESGFQMTDYLDQVTEVRIGEGITSVKGTVFSEMVNLESIDFPSSLTHIQSHIGGIFSQNHKLKSVYIPANVTQIDSIWSSEFSNPFRSCEGLTAIEVSPSNPCFTSQDGVLFDKDMHTLFSYPKGQTGTYTIPNGVTQINNQAFVSCRSLTAVSFPISVKEIGEEAFSSCTGLTNISIPSSVTTIGWSAFSGCTRLTNISIPSSVTSIGAYAFCSTGLTDITIPDSVTLIAMETFEECSELASITIPSSVTEIGNGAFCATGLKDVYYDGTAEQWAAIKIGSVNSALTNATIHYKDIPNPEAPQIVVDRKTFRAGRTADVQISLQNNPGITSLKLMVEFDETVLTLTDVKDGGVLGGQVHSNNMHSPYTLSWANDTATSNFMTNGPIVTLTFSISPQAAAGTYPIRISYEKEKDEILDKDMNRIDFSVVAGSVTVTDVLPGDANRDGQVTSIDRIFVARHLANWSGYTQAEVDLAAADVNDDAKVTSVDRIILARHLADWSGYESLPYLAGAPSAAGLFDLGDSSPAIRVSDAPVQSDGTAALTISLENNPGIISLLLHVTFDESALELLAVEDAGVLGSQIHSDSRHSPYTLSWANDTAAENFRVNGEIVTLYFRLKNGASATSYPVQISYDLENDEILDKDFNRIQFEVYHGSIYVGQTIRLGNLQVTGNSVSVSVIGNPGTGSKLVVAAYGEKDQFLGLQVQDAVSAGIYRSTLNTTKYKKIAVMLVDNSWRPLCEKKDNMTT